MSDQEEQNQPQEENKEQEQQQPQEEAQPKGEEQPPQGQEEDQELLKNKILSNEEGGEEGENPPQEEAEPEVPQKVYAPPNPTIKECIQLNQILPVSQIDSNIDAISNVIYENDDLLNEFLQKVDNRTQISNDDPKGEFIKCEQNREGDSYRSPISNQYFPPIEDAKYPSKPLRDLEEKLNKMFHQYTKAYYSSTAHVSCYCWDLTEKISDGFGVAVLIKNSINHENDINLGIWDSSNVVNVTFEEEGGKIKAKYSLVTTVSLSMGFSSKICGSVSLSGTIGRTANTSKVVKNYIEDSHVENIGVLIEDLESNIRNTIDTIYVMKSKEIVDTARYNPTLGKPGIEQAQALKMAFMASKGH